MKTNNNSPAKKIEAGIDDPTASFPNGRKASAASVNNTADKKSKNYMHGEDDQNGPDMNLKSKNEDGDTTVNAGIYK